MYMLLFQSKERSKRTGNWNWIWIRD